VTYGPNIPSPQWTIAIRHWEPEHVLLDEYRGLAWCGVRIRYPELYQPTMSQAHRTEAARGLGSVCRHCMAIYWQERARGLAKLAMRNAKTALTMKGGGPYAARTQRLAALAYARVRVYLKIR
jgi:hypothetical protein